MKKKRLLIALLSLTCASTLAVGLSACGGDKHDSAIYSLYQTYAQNAGENALTYEKWLESILVNGGNDGKPGANGKSAYEIAVENGFTGTQAQWLASLVGENGLSAYEQYCEANPDYEGDEAQWLASLVGAKGTNGKSAYEIYVEETKKENPDALVMDEAQWLASLAGGQGVGIADISLSADGTTLTVTYTDSSKQPTVINLPGAFHIHTYGEVVTVIAPTVEADGIGYHTCSVDGHAEVVVIPRLGYNITVYAEDGSTPLEGVTVTINGDSGETDEDGKIKLTGFGEPGEYPINLSGYGDSYHYFTVSTSEESNTFNITLAKILNEGDNIDHAGRYAAEFNDWEENGTWELNEVKPITVGKEGEDAKYNFSFTTGNIIINSRYYYYNSPDCFVIANSEFKKVELVMHSNTVGSSRPDPVYMQVNVTTGSVPARGTRDNPISVTLGDNSATAPADGYYFTFRHNMLAEDYDLGKLIFTFGQDTTLAVVMDNTEFNVTSGEVIPNLDKYKDYLLIARPTQSNTSGEVNFKTQITYDNGKWLRTAYPIDGLSVNPIERAVDGVTYFKYTPDRDETAVLTLSMGSSVVVFENPSFTEQLSRAFASVNKDGFVVLNLTGGTDYYFQYNPVSAETTCSFVLREMTADDEGVNPATAVQLTSGEEGKALSGNKGTVPVKYYKVDLENEKELSLSLVNGNGTTDLSITVEFYSDAAFSKRTARQYVTLKGAAPFNYGMFPAEGVNAIYIKIIVRFATENFNIVPTVKFADIVDYSLKLVDKGNNAVNGVSVSIVKGEDVVATSITNAEGVATFTGYEPGIYSLRFDGNDDYVGNSVETAADVHNFELTVEKYVQYTFTVLGESNAPLENVTVNVKLATPSGMDYLYSDYGTGKTGTNGQVTIKLQTVGIGYKFVWSVSDMPEGYSMPTPQKVREFTVESDQAGQITINLVPPVKESDTLIGLHKLKGSEEEAVAFTASASGVYIVTTTYQGGFDSYSIDGGDPIACDYYAKKVTVTLNAGQTFKIWGWEDEEFVIGASVMYEVSTPPTLLDNKGEHAVANNLLTAETYAVTEDGQYLFMDDNYDGGLVIVVNGVEKAKTNAMTGAVVELKSGDQVQVYSSYGSDKYCTNFIVTKQ